MKEKSEKENKVKLSPLFTILTSPPFKVSLLEKLAFIFASSSTFLNIHPQTSYYLTLSFTFYLSPPVI